MKKTLEDLTTELAIFRGWSIKRAEQEVDKVMKGFEENYNK